MRSLLGRELGDGTTLDVGCGKFSPLRNIERNGYRVGLDFYQPYIIKSRSSHIHDDYAMGDVRVLPFGDKSFGCAVAVEILEHLTKDDARKMLQEMERVASKIVLTTPNGFLPTYAGPNDNPSESHVSGWTVSELKKLGFKVYGVGWPQAVLDNQEWQGNAQE